MANKDGFDSKKSWGNSALKGHGVNSPAMMEARASASKSKALSRKIGNDVTPRKKLRKVGNDMVNK